MVESAVTPTKITRRGLLRSGVRLGIGAAALSSGALAFGRYVEPDWIEVEQVEIPLPRLPRAFDGFRLAQISDIHIEDNDMQRYFPGIAKLVTAQRADAIVMTGDYTTYADTWQEDALYEGFQHLQAPCGVWGVLGNHDQWMERIHRIHGANVVRSALARAGVVELPNTAQKIERDGATLWMCGLDDWMSGFADLPRLLDLVPDGAPAILLHHEPDFADEIAPTGRFDLMLSGHSHGGQIALPVIGPLHLPPFCEKYPRGLYQVGDMALYTNRGLGTVGPPVRLFSRPEITVFTLRCA